jgi:hypothetical protein
MPIEPRLNASPRENIGPLNKRPARGKKDGELYTSEVGIFAWDAEASVWRGGGANSVVGVAGVQTVYVATGQRAMGVSKAGNFNADITEATDYEITTPGSIVTLKSTDPTETVFQFHCLGAGFVASPVVLTPNNGILINGAATYNIDRDHASQYVRKMLDGSWHAGQ